METPFLTSVKMTPEDIAKWQEERIRDTWRVFRIMSEFVEGFEMLARVGPCVSVFGSARTAPGSHYYEMGTAVSAELAKRGYGIITGGGPGIMEAGNKGAREANGVSIGLNITLPHEQHNNPYIDPDKSIDFDFFFARKTMLVKYAMGFVVLPGGFGTLDEFFEALTLIQTGKSPRFPIVLMGTSFWQGLLDWLQDSVLAEGNISPKDKYLYFLTDDPTEAADHIDEYCRKHGHVINLEA